MIFTMRQDKKRVEKVVTRLEKLYDSRLARPVFDPLEELISCILTQNSTDNVAFPTFEKLRKKYPTWEEIAGLSVSALEKEIRPVGLSKQKARAILGTLKEVYKKVGKYSINFLEGYTTEDAMKWLQSLPGVGPKTSAIVMMFSFNRDVIPVDTHVFRVAYRLGFIEKKIGPAKAHDELLKIVPVHLAKTFHIVLIQHGRKVCKALKPQCDKCVVSGMCEWYKEKKSQIKGSVVGGTSRMVRAKQEF